MVELLNSFQILFYAFLNKSCNQMFFCSWCNAVLVFSLFLKINSSDLLLKTDIYCRYWTFNSKKWTVEHLSKQFLWYFHPGIRSFPQVSNIALNGFHQSMLLLHVLTGKCGAGFFKVGVCVVGEGAHFSSRDVSLLLFEKYLDVFFHLLFSCCCKRNLNTLKYWIQRWGPI